MATSSFAQHIPVRIAIQLLVLFSLINPAAPVFASNAVSLRHIGGWGGFPGSVEKVTSRGNSYAVISTGSCLNVFKVNDPANPQLCTEVFTGGIIAKMKCTDSLACIVTDSGFVIFDISSPENPVRKGSCVLVDSNYIYDIAFSGNYVFIAGSRIAIQIIDVSNSGQPVKVSEYSPDGGGGKLAVYSNYVYVLNRWYEKRKSGYDLHIVDVSDINIPVFKDKYRFYYDVDGMTLSGTNLFLSNSVVRALDISNPEKPVEIDSCDTPWRPYEIAISGDYAFVADSDSGLQVISIADPANMSIAGSCNLKEHGLYTAENVSIFDNYAYLWRRIDDLHIVAITNPTKPEWTGMYRFNGSGNHVTVSGKYAYFSDMYNGFQILDVSNPGVPEIIGSLPLSGAIFHIVLTGDTAFMASEDSSVKIIDVSDPSNPGIINTIPLSTTANFVCIQNGLAYTLCSEYDLGAGGYLGAFNIFDVSDLLNPIPLGDYPINYPLLALSVVKEHALISAGALYTLDIHDPQKPVCIDTLTGIQNYYHTSSDDHAFLACGHHGFKILDISDPASTEIVAEYNDLNPLSSMPGYTFVTYDNGIAYTVDTDNGLQIVRVTDPEQPEKLFTTGYRWTNSAAVSGNHLYLLRQGNGMQIYEVKGLQTPIITNKGKSTLHNPINVCYNNGYFFLNNLEGPAKVSLYDCAGKMVSSLKAGLQKQTLRLPEIAAGVYIIRVHTRNDIITGRVLVTK